MSKVTKWLPSATKPVRTGIYQRNYGGKELIGIVYSHWDGRRWGLFGNSPAEAERLKELSSTYQSFSWRGLASDPSKATK